MSVQFYLAYVAACVAITIVPGPTVSLIIANSMTHGTRLGSSTLPAPNSGLPR
jgi:threonine/homoserine/homoserine lactone efflux protein